MMRQRILWIYILERYPGVLTYMESTREKRKAKTGYVQPLYWSQTFTYPILKQVTECAEKVLNGSLNAPMQGTAAEHY